MSTIVDIDLRHSKYSLLLVFTFQALKLILSFCSSVNVWIEISNVLFLSLCRWMDRDI